MLEVDSSGVIKATGNLEKFAAASKRAEQSASGIDDVFSRMNLSSLAAVAGVTALVGALAKVKGAFSSAINTYAGFEKLEVGLTGVMRNLGNTQKAADSFVDSLRKLSNETTFGYDTLAGVAQQMLTVGVSTEDTKQRLIQLGNIAGGSTEKFNRLSEVYTKILATGKASSMQIQQLSMITGTSFVNALGKTSASAKEVTELFQKMTEAGGMFEGAMDSLIDTVEGKQGFVTDVFAEMTRNFAEASGLVDVYKGVMDALYTVLQALADKLLEINQNPLQKALLSGAIAAVLTTVGTLVGVGIVGAVKKLNAELTKTVVLKSVLDPKTLAIAAGVGIVAGAVAGVAAAWKKVKDDTEAAKKAVDEFNTKIDKSPIGLNNRNMQFYDNEIDANKKQIEKYRKEIEATKKYAVAAMNAGITPEAITKNEKLIAMLEAQNEVYEARKKTLEANNAVISEFNAKADELTPILEGQKSSNEKALEDLQKTLETLKAVKKAAQDASSLTNTTAVESQVDDAITKALKKERELKIKIAVENLSDWQKVLKNAMGFTDEEAANGYLSTGAMAVNKFAEKLGLQELNRKAFKDAKLINTDNLTIAENKLESINSVIEAIEKSGLWKVSEDTVNKLKELRNLATADVYDEQIKSLDRQLELMQLQTEELRVQQLMREKGYSSSQAKSIVEKESEVAKASDPMAYLQQVFGDMRKGYSQSASDNFSKTGDEFVKIFQNIKSLDLPGTFRSVGDMFKSVGAGILDTLNGIAIGFASSVVSASSDLNAFMQGFQSGGIWGGIIATVVNALMNVCRGIEDFEDALNPVTYLFQNLSVLIDFLMGVITNIVHLIGNVAKIINTLLKIIQPLLNGLNKVIGFVINLIGKAADAIANFISAIFWWVDTSDELAEAQEDEAERLRRLNDEYAALYDAMKEQEEYYLTKKNALNADTYKENVTKVNDMILTDKGIFSTDPKDTIMAMKDPSSLMGGGNIYVTINNNADVEVSTEESTRYDGSRELIVTISQAVASDFASGANGWDGAYAAQQSRISGRRVSI